MAWKDRENIMPTDKINLIKGDRRSTNTDYRDALSVNMYAVDKSVLGADGYMLCYPGLTQYSTGIGIDRAGVYNDRFGDHYRVSGEHLISVDTDGTLSTIGTISGDKQASMPYSFNTQCVIADGRMFLYDETNGFREVTDSDLGDPIDGTWVDGYYFLTDGEYIYHTDLNDESSIDPLKFATAEFMPDKSLGVAKTQDNKVVVFGRNTIEYFRNVASDNFAFTRVQERAQKIGIVATHAKCEAGGRFYFTGGRKEEALAVYNLGVGASTKVSTREVDKILAQYTEPELSDMRMETRAQDDGTYIIVHLPNEALCFSEKIAKKFGIDFAWCILKTDVAGDSPYRAINGVFDSDRGQWVYGDKRDSTIGYLDDTVFTHYGEMVEWILYTPIVKLEGASLDEVEIETIPGHTIADDATVAISVTFNGLTYGKEWFNMYGEPLDYGRRFIARRVCYVPDTVGIKFRSATKSRMAFALARLSYG